MRAFVCVCAPWEEITREVSLTGCVRLIVFYACTYPLYTVGVLVKSKKEIKEKKKKPRRVCGVEEARTALVRSVPVSDRR